MRHSSALVIGGGPAGSASAIALARGGQRPIVLERSRETGDTICGGFLSWNTVRHLCALGVDPEALGARPIRNVALFAGTLSARSRLPRKCHGLSRRTLDTALLRAAQGAGAVVERGVHVTALDGCRAVFADGGEAEGSALVLATGKHDLRGSARSRTDHDPAIGLRWRLLAGPRLAALVDDAVELHLFRGGYAGLELQEDGTANLCLTVRRSLLSMAGSDPAHLLDRLAATELHLGARLDAAGGFVGKVDAVANIPYGWRAASEPGAPYRVGDQAAVIPSLAGEGIAIALTSGLAAAEAILRDESASSYQQRQFRRHRRPLAVAGQVWRFAETRRGAKLMVNAAAAVPGSAAMLAWMSRVQ